MTEIKEVSTEILQDEDNLVGQLDDDHMSSIDIYGGCLVDVEDVKLEVYKGTGYSKKGHFSLKVTSKEIDAIKNGKLVVYNNIELKPLVDSINIILFHPKSAFNN